jgi:hypothetical protein
MTDLLKWRAVATAFAALSPIGGVKVVDFAHIPADAKLLTPILFPWPGGAIKGLKPERLTLASGGIAKYQLTYAMTWRYLHAPIAAGLGGFSDYDGFMANMDAIYAAILTNADVLTGSATVYLPDVPGVGPTFDPSYNQYHGCDLTFQVFAEI